MVKLPTHHPLDSWPGPPGVSNEGYQAVELNPGLKKKSEDARLHRTNWKLYAE